MCKQLQEDKTREKTLNRQLQRSDYNNEEAFEFLLLLENPNWKDTTTFKAITEDNLAREVKRRKKKSTSLIFSRRTHAACKCVLNCVRIIVILVSFYNMLLKTHY